MVYFNQQIKEDKIMRVIYMIEGFTQDGDLEFRRFAHTKRIAERIKRKNNSTEYVVARKLNKNEHYFVNPDDVE